MGCKVTKKYVSKIRSYISLSDNIARAETSGPVHPTAANTITTYTLCASPLVQTLTHTYLAFHTWLTTKMGMQESL